VLGATGGKLGALFNNGAYGQPGAVEDLRREVLRAQFEAGFFGWHDLTARIIPAMRKHGEGRIVFCSSVLGWSRRPIAAPIAPPSSPSRRSPTRSAWSSPRPPSKSC
jgi:NAD(P)-dependent dehydrogenase (short-subunit alcohol dehydrogenase family)